MIVKVIEAQRKRLKRLRTVLWVYLGSLVVLDLFLPREDAHYLIDRLPAFWTLFALIGCYVLVVISKGVAHLLLARGEDYYG